MEIDQPGFHTLLLYNVAIYEIFAYLLNEWINQAFIFKPLTALNIFES